MRRRTTTQKLHNALSNNLLTVEKAESYNKTTRQTEEISVDTFKDGLDFLCETIFADSIGWYFEKGHVTGNYEIDCSRMDRSSDIVISAHLCANEGVNDVEINDALLFLEE